MTGRVTCLFQVPKQFSLTRAMLTFNCWAFGDEPIVQRIFPVEVEKIGCVDNLKEVIKRAKITFSNVDANDLVLSTLALSMILFTSVRFPLQVMGISPTT
jgi:hypothetical protein